MSSRREFVGHLVGGAAATALLATAGLALGGCPKVETVISDLQRWMPVGLQAFAGVVAIINPLAGSALALAVVASKAVWTDVSAAIAGYENAPATGKDTWLHKIQTVLGQLIVSLPDIIKNVGANVPALSTITAALNLIMSTVSTIDASLGGVPPVVAGAAPRAVVTGKQFKSQFNQIVINGGYPQHAI